jgi:uncharacterized Ntn-hydrolase superfamily protein
MRRELINRTIWMVLGCLALLLPPAPGAARPGLVRGEVDGPGLETPGPLVHTFSIVARDTLSGQMGVAVQSHWFSVGPVVPWAEAGVGAVATQSFVDVSYGPLGLDMMRAGRSAKQSLRALLTADPHPEVRQVAMIDASGGVAAHTGASCIAEAGHIIGKDYSVQANLMASDQVWPAMAEAFESTEGDLADRMLAALEAGQAAGGDIRGRQSAAILVVRQKPTGRVWEDRVIDLRVEDAPHPIEELKRLVTLHRAYEHEGKGDEYVAQGDLDAALREYTAAAALAPDNMELVFWEAVSLINVGREIEAMPLFKKVFAADKNWAVLTPRLVQSGLLNVDDKTLKTILDQAGQ